MAGAQYQKLAQDEESWTSERGKLTLRSPLPHVLVVRVEGEFQFSLVPYYKTPIDRAIAQGIFIHVFNDWWEMSGYDAETRVDLTNWTLPIRRKVNSHILLRSKIVALGVSAANFALGGALNVHTDRASFDAALNKSLRA